MFESGGTDKKELDWKMYFSSQIRAPPLLLEQQRVHRTHRASYESHSIHQFEGKSSFRTHNGLVQEWIGQFRQWKTVNRKRPVKKSRVDADTDKVVLEAVVEVRKLPAHKCRRGGAVQGGVEGMIEINLIIDVIKE